MSHPQPTIVEPTLANSSALAHTKRCTISWLEIFCLSALLTLANVWKPLHIDDAAYYAYARQIASHPLDPYGFRIFWYQTWEPAQQVLAPPVLPAWWAIGLRLFGERPWLWKLWLWPVCLLFVWALARLLSRFTPRLERPLLWMTVLSPVCLPALNLMLDIPALALGLAAIVLCIQGLDRASLVESAAAGVVAGVALQTKYTALLLPGVFCFYALCLALVSTPMLSRQRWTYLGYALLASTIAGGIFVGWEAWLAWAHPANGSHFLFHLRANSHDPMLLRMLDQLSALPGLLGSIGAGIGLLALAVLSQRRMTVGIAIGWLLLTYGVILCVGARFMARAHVHLLPGTPPMRLDGPFPLEAVLFSSLGMGVAGTLVVVCWRLLRATHGWPGLRRLHVNQAMDWFLVGWLVIELAGYLGLSPFPAARRCMGLAIVATLVIGRFASRAPASVSMRRLIWAAAGVNIALGVVYGVVDFRLAGATQFAAEDAGAWIAAQHEPGKVWYAGHWGFQFYAEQAGMEPLDPGHTWLAQGDWVVLPDSGIVQQTIVPRQDCLQLRHIVQKNSFAPVSTMSREFGGYHGTSTGAALLHQDNPRVSVRIYRVTRSHRCQ